jgi:hypothetical protein
MMMSWHGIVFIITEKKKSKEIKFILVCTFPMTASVAETCLHRLELRSLTQKQINITIANVFHVVNRRCVKKQEFFLDDQLFSPNTSTSEWQLDLGGTFVYKVTENWPFFMQSVLPLHGHIVQIICQFEPHQGESDGLEIFDAKDHLLLDKVIEGKSISEWIGEALQEHWENMIECHEVNAVTGQLEKVPLTRVSFDIWRWLTIGSAFSLSYPDRNLQLITTENYSNYFTVVPTLRYAGKRRTYSISKLTSLDLTFENAKFSAKPNKSPYPSFDVLRIGGSHKLVQLGLMFDRSPGGRWLPRG